MKYVIVIGDGMADNAVPALGGKTPLETVIKPTMDALAMAGELGLVRTVPQGVPPGSDTAILSIFGYDPKTYFSGRSPLEAAGCGVEVHAGEVTYRCNMVTLGGDSKDIADRCILSHSGGGIEGDEALGLMDALLHDEAFCRAAQKNGMVFHPTPSFRHIVVQKGVDIAGLVAPPPHEHLDERVGDNLPHGCAAATGLIEMMLQSNRVLEHHPINEERRAEGKMPANALWFWAEGSAIVLPDFKQAHSVRGLAISAVPLVHGIARLAGLDSTTVEGATGELDTNYEGKADAALKGLFEDGYDFALVHVESPDECTHNGDTEGKLQAIEWLDGRTIARLKAGLDASGQPYRMLILSDHKTLTATRGHDADPVPYILYDSRENKGGAFGYTEANAENGPFIDPGYTLVGRLMER